MSERIVYDSVRQPGAKLTLHWWKNRRNSTIPSRGYVWIVHGIGEHGARYRELAVFLTGFGFDVLAPDLPGHGLSRAEGGLTKIPSIPDIVAELRGLQHNWLTRGPAAKQGAANAPWFLIGHSLGALISLQWILEGKRSEEEGDFAKRVFLSAAPLRLKMPVPAWKTSLATVLEGLAPDFAIPNGIAADDLSYDVGNVAAYRQDPLVHNQATPRIYNSMVRVGEDALSRPRDIEVPMFLAIGADDPIADPVTLRGFFDGLGTHKKFAEIPHTKHEILNDMGRQRCFDAIASWFL
jgi:alpha-beta hydrolase superfamily lysophospholipase